MTLTLTFIYLADTFIRSDVEFRQIANQACSQAVEGPAFKLKTSRVEQWQFLGLNS